MTTPSYTSPTLFDDVLGVPVPTLHRDGAEQRDALAAAQEPPAVTMAEEQARAASATDLEAFALAGSPDRAMVEASHAELARRGIDLPPVRLVHYLAPTPWTAEHRTFACIAPDA